ncbi:MAG: GDSL-type esterase/lipase family protein, partial [Oscillospiraceae bacterium]|nr:GDSL-type esterase/lipase family protein [Oscillospiraceae bacterium]
EYERKRNNLLNNVAECDIPSVCKSIFVKIEEVENVLKTLEENLENETRNQSVISEPQIRFFLNSLKKGNTSDIKYRKALITMFVNTIYLYDDKMTLVFNSGDDPVTIDDFLLSEIEENFQHMEKGLFLDKVSPPAIEERVFCTLFFCYIILTNTFVYCIIVTLKKIFNKSEEKMKFKLTAVLTAAALSLTMVPFVVTSTASAETPTVLVLGDSISTGYGLSDTDNSYASLVADYYGATYVNYAQDGLKAEELKVSLENGTYDTELSKADYVLVTIGGNDIIAPALEIIQKVTKKYGYEVNSYKNVKELLSAFSSKDQKMVDEVIEELGNNVFPKKVSKDYVKSCIKYVSEHTNGKVVFQTVYNPFSVNTSSSEWAPYKSRLDNINTKMDMYCNTMKKYYAEAADENSNAQLLDAYSYFAGHGETLTNIESIDIHPNQAGHLYLAADTISLLGGNAGGGDKLKASYNSIAEPYKTNLLAIEDANTKISKAIDSVVEPTTEPITTTEPVTTTVTTTTTQPVTTTTTTTTTTQPVTTAATTTTTKPVTTTAVTTTTTEPVTTAATTTTTKPETTTTYATKPTTITTVSTIATSATTVTTKPTENKSLGDVNNDGAVDSKDAVIVLKDYASFLTSNKYSLDIDKADINGDGKIDSKDAVLILKYYAEKLASGSSISMADYVKDIKK